MTAFVDTSALYATLDRDDANHRAAARTWSRLVEDGEPLVVTNYVIVETLALVQHRLGMPAVKVLVNDLLPIVTSEWVTTADHQAAVASLLLAGRRGLSLVDCVSFTVMRRLGLRSAFAFDRHFRTEGFEAVNP